MLYLLIEVLFKVLSEFYLKMKLAVLALVATTLGHSSRRGMTCGPLRQI